CRYCSGRPRGSASHRDAARAGRLQERAGGSIDTSSGAEMLEFELSVNGERYAVRAEPRKLLSDALREDCRLTGTHVGCEHGVCGACTVLVDGRPARACLVYAAQMQGHEISTIEGVAKDGKLSPLQQALHEAHGLQCGFCTAGIVM